MKITHLSLSDTRGGAHKAGYRLHRALIKEEIASLFYVFFKDTDDYTVVGPETKYQLSKNFIRYVLDSYPKLLFKTETKFSSAIVPSDTLKQISKLSQDLLHFHWINGGVLRIKDVSKINTPIIWTLHDMWPFTGGCHYDMLCGRYENSCGKCPIIKSNKQKDLSYKILHKKSLYWSKLNLTVVAPSKWLGGCAQKSTIFKNNSIEVIPNCINTELFKPWNKEFARQILGLPQDKLLILASALNILNDSRKGFSYLSSALSNLSTEGIARDIDIVVLGSSQPHNPSDLSLPVHYLGYLRDEISIALVYSAVDIFVASSVQDNLPNTIVESLACGTPCAAFSIGGIPDLIEHKKNGYLAKPFEAEDLANGILWMINSSDRLKQLSYFSREYALQNLSSDIIADRYLELYKKVLSRVR